MTDSENYDSQSNSMNNLNGLLDSSTLLHEKRIYQSEPAGLFTIEATEEGEETTFCISMIQPIVVSKNDSYDIELPEGNIKIKYPGIIQGVEVYFTDQNDEVNTIYQSSAVTRESCNAFYNKLLQIDPVNAALDFLQYQQYQGQIVTGYNFVIDVNNQEIICNPVISEVYYLVPTLNYDKITNIEIDFIGHNIEQNGAAFE